MIFSQALSFNFDFSLLNNVILSNIKTSLLTDMRGTKEGLIIVIGKWVSKEFSFYDFYAFLMSFP